MANNMNAILAGQAYVRYYADNAEFKKGNKDAEEDFRRTTERMRKQDEDRRAKEDYRMRQHLDRMRKQREKADYDEEQSLARKNYRMYQQLQRQSKQREDLQYAEYIKQVKFNSKILELEQAKDRKSQDMAYAEYLRMVKFNSRVLELQQAKAKKSEDLQYAEYIKQVKFNSKILELEQAKDRKSQDRAWASYINMVKFNSRVLEGKQKHEQELLRTQERSQQVQENSLNAFFDRQERKRKENIRRERADRSREAREAAQQEQQIRDRDNAAMRLAVGGTYLGGRMMSMGRAGFGGIMSSVREYAGVEEAMLAARVNLADNSGNLNQDMKMLQREAYKVGVKTEYDARQIAQMQERLSISDLSPQQIAGSIQPITNVASVFSNGLNGKIEPARAARTVMEMVTAMKYGAEQIPMVADKLAVAGRLADVSLENLADAFRYAGGSAIEAGMNFDQVLAALVVLDKRGMKGEMGGTALRGIVASLLDQTKEAQAEYAKFGIRVPAKGKLNLEEVIRQFEDRLGGMSEIERATVIAKAFPNRQMTGVQMLVGASGQMDMMRGKLSASAGEGERYAKSKREGVGFSLDVVQSAWESAKGSFGETFKDETNWAARKLAGGIEGTGEFLQNNPMIGKGVAYGSGALSAGGMMIGGTGTLMGMYYGGRVLNASLQTLGTSIPGLARGIGRLGLSAVSSTAMLTAAAVKAAAWPVTVAAGITAIGLALDQAFNKGRIGNFYASGLRDVASYFNGQWDKSDSVSNENDKKVLGADEFKTKTNTFIRDNAGVIIGEVDAQNGQRTMYDFKDTKGNEPYKRYPLRNGVQIDPFTGQPVDPKTGRPKNAGAGLKNLIARGESAWQNFGGMLADGVKAGQGLLSKQQAWARENYVEGRDAIMSDRSPENPENLKAWREYMAANPTVKGFEDESRQQRAGGWYSFLQNYRRDKAMRGNSAVPAALAKLGDFEMRSSTGQDYILDMLYPRAKKEDANIAEQMLVEAKKTNKLLEDSAVIPKKMGSGR